MAAARKKKKRRRPAPRAQQKPCTSLRVMLRLLLCAAMEAVRQAVADGWHWQHGDDESF